MYLKLMKLLFITIILLFSNFSIFAASKELINKAIICKEIHNDFKSMYGFNFIDEESEDFDFNQDLEFGEEARSPGWIRYQKKLNDK